MNPSDMRTVVLARRSLDVFYVLDTSGSMAGASIAALNVAMQNTVEALADATARNVNANIKMAVMDFNTHATWHTPTGPIPVEDYRWDTLRAGGLTAVGEALDGLNQKLRRSEFLGDAAGSYLPVIIFMSDGYATDPSVYPEALKAIRKNPWFASATKVGFALGDDPDVKMISEVVGNSKAVIRTTDLDEFSRLITFVSKTATVAVSTSRVTPGLVTGASLVESIAPGTVVLDDGEYSREFASVTDPVWSQGRVVDDFGVEWI